jgi:lambda repressor-like predicted transcriptional regulator
MSPAYIKYRLNINGYTLTKLAAENNVTPQAIYAVINLKSDSNALASAISKAAGEDIDQLFPDGRYSLKAA